MANNARELVLSERGEQNIRVAHGNAWEWYHRRRRKLRIERWEMRKDAGEKI